MLRRILSIVIAFAATTAVAMGQNPEPARPGDRANQPPDRPASAAQTADRQTPAAPLMDTRMFVNAMAIAGMAEVQLGKLAAERAANADVKKFGEMMVTDHSKAGDELKAVATRLSVPMPTALDAKHRDLVDKLSKLKGAEFDREYMTAMVSGHEEVANALRARAQATGRSTTAQPPAANQPPAQKAETPAGATAVGTGGSAAGEEALTQWAAKALPTVQMHLERARALQQTTAR